MAIIQNVIGDSSVVLLGIHNGGGVGWGEVINGGFGMVLTDRKKHQNESNMLFWDVNNGI
jgi:urocanate hydratase